MDIDISPVQADELGLLGRDSPQTYCRKCDINQIYNDIWLRARNIWYANGLQLMPGQHSATEPSICRNFVDFGQEDDFTWFLAIWKFLK